jgi:gluconate kinase
MTDDDAAFDRDHAAMAEALDAWTQRQRWHWMKRLRRWLSSPMTRTTFATCMALLAVYTGLLIFVT